MRRSARRQRWSARMAAMPLRDRLVPDVDERTIRACIHHDRRDPPEAGDGGGRAGRGAHHGEGCAGPGDEAQHAGVLGIDPTHHRTLGSLLGDAPEVLRSATAPIDGSGTALALATIAEQ